MIDSLDNYVVFDIETYTITKNAMEIAKNSKPKMGNLKDPDKIEKKLEDHKQSILNKGALTWYTGEIRSIAAYRYHDDSTRVFYWPVSDQQIVSSPYKVVVCSGEDELLESFYNWVDKKQLIGMNSKNFDIPFMIGRSVVNNIAIPNQVKNYSRSICQIDDLLTFSNSNSQRTSLQNMAIALGIDGKLGEGCAVKKMLEDGAHIDLIEYNVQDVEIVKEFINRYNRRFGFKKDDVVTNVVRIERNYEDVF